MHRQTHRRKVLLLITKSNFGGAQRYVFDLATQLPSEQYDVVVALGGDGPLAQKLAAAGVRTITLHHMRNTTSPVVLRRIIAELKTVFREERPDIIHANSSIAGVAGMMAGRLVGIPKRLFTAHGWAFNEDRPLLQRLIFKCLHWVTVRCSTHTITVSDAVRTQMGWPGTQSKMQTIHLGRQPITFLERPAARATLCERVPTLAPFTADPWIISIGELHPVKRHTDAIAALATLLPQHPTLRYLIIGEGQERATLTEQINTLNLHDHVFLLGHLDSAARLLKAADLFLFPSRSEALGYAALEAAQAALPIVATRVGGIPEIITDGTSGSLVPPHQPDALATAIAKYRNNPTLAQTHAAAAHIESLRFSIDAMVRATATLYQS
jgi:glycosyltransferase involved in cell wall biosynthesis